MSREIRQQEGKPGGKSWVIEAVALLDDIIIIAAVFLLLWIFDVELSVWAYVLIGVLLAAFIFISHRALVSSLHKRKTTGREGMLGQTGIVTETLSPRGTVQIGSEYWKASCAEGLIEEGDEVTVTAIRGLCLEVRKKV